MTLQQFFLFFRHLSDINKDNALNVDEFCIAMHLVVALRHGLELPSTLPNVLLPVNKETAVSGIWIYGSSTTQSIAALIEAGVVN